jgi:hypothetical protein
MFRFSKAKNSFKVFIAWVNGRTLCVIGEMVMSSPARPTLGICGNAFLAGLKLFRHVWLGILREHGTIKALKI